MVETNIRSRWLENTLANADVAAAHERTMHLHKVAVVGALALKNNLPGQEKRFKTDSIGWGILHALGPTREWTDVRWTSTPVHIGEAPENELGLEHEFMTLEVNGTIETTTKRGILGSKKTETLKGEDFKIQRRLGDNPASPENTIIAHPRKPFEAYIDRNYTCRDARRYTKWSQEEQIEDYEQRVSQIISFLRELDILSGAAKVVENWEYSAHHILQQSGLIAGVTNRNTLT